jgi:demethylmenaquinone methyltransferase/2-methoxy-6-polyprenyl-1,4-benzoquinol methylase
MFNSIAHRYDLANHLLSFNIEKRWRRRMGRFLPAGEHLRLLDLATGTGDQIITLFKHFPQLKTAIGLDLSENMVALGAEKIAAAGLADQVEMVQGDGTQLPFVEPQFDVITISFGIRNVLDVSACLGEMWRVLHPGGRSIILEFSLPRNAVMRWSYLLYFRHILPILGGLISGNRTAYKYLNQTVETFPYGTAFGDLMIQAGFTNVQLYPLTFGIATIYTGDKPHE